MARTGRLPVIGEMEGWMGVSGVGIPCFYASHPVELPLDLPNRYVSPASAIGPDDDSQVVVEPPKSGLRDLVGLQIGP